MFDPVWFLVYSMPVVAFLVGAVLIEKLVPYKD